MPKTKTFFLLFFIVALGLFLRIYNIESVPPGVYPDEAVNGMDAISASSGNWQWFYPANNGREGLFINIIALCFKFLGISVLSLRLPSIIFGTLTILGTYLLAKELFQSRRIGLISAFLVSVSFWAIDFSRISFRANALPTILVFSFYFLWKGLRTKKWYDFAFGGLVFGLGLHTYISFRIAPLILIPVFASLLISKEKFLRTSWKSILVFILFTLVTAAPMLYTFFVSHPEYWQSRTSEISLMNPQVNQGHFFKAFFRTFSLSLLKYNLWGDQNWRHNFPPYAILDPATATAFLFGLIYSIGKLAHLLTIRFACRIRQPQLNIYAFLIAWFFIMLVPEFMAVEGNPHALRSIGTLPVAMIFSAVTFEYFYKKSRNYSPASRNLITALIVLIFLSIGFFNAAKYHLAWANKKETATSFDKNLMDVSGYIKSLPASSQKIIVAQSMQRIPIQLFNLSLPNTYYFYPAEIQSLPQKTVSGLIVILTDMNDEIISAIEQKFPGVAIEEKSDTAGAIFWIIEPGEEKNYD